MVKKLKDEEASYGENEITELFLAMAGCEALSQISAMAYPKELEEPTYEGLFEGFRKI